MSTTIKVLLCVFIIGGIGIVFAESGVYNISAAEPHTGMVRWIFSTVRDRSIDVRADSVPLPVGASHDPGQIKTGFRSYHAMCQICHAAPGAKPTAIRQGLNPQPPKLDSERVRNRTDGELFWIVKNGIKMTGMPAFGKTHADRDLWPIIAFVKQLPEIGAEQYARMIEETGLSEDTPGAGHHEQ